MSSPFTAFPAIDLRRGQVVRLQQGDPDRQTLYSSDAVAAAESWLSEGVRWIHVVDLDAALGDGDPTNKLVIQRLQEVASRYHARIQLGGGLRSLDSLRTVLESGISRGIIGTAAVENQDYLIQAISLYGSERIAAAIDARNGFVQVRGWQTVTSVRAVDLGKRLAAIGLRWIIYTDIQRDGVGTGVNIGACLEMAQATGANVIASGGVDSLQDITAAKEANLAGIIVGRALYDHKISIKDCIGI